MPAVSQVERALAKGKSRKHFQIVSTFWGIDTDLCANFAPTVMYCGVGCASELNFGTRKECFLWSHDNPIASLEIRGRLINAS